MQVKVEDLGRADVKKLAQILYLDINKFQERETAGRLIADLPSYLRRACFTHKALNREVVHAICGFIREEVGEGLNGLATSQTKLSTEQRRMVHNLRTVNGLWMTRQAVERKYLIRPSFTWFYQGDGCEACMISRFARDRAVLTDMRTVLLSRIGRRKARGLPPLVPWVEELMNCHGPSSLEMFVFSGEDALELKAVRKDIKAISSQGYNPRASHGGLRRAESNVTHRPNRWASVNSRQAARRPRSLEAIRRRESTFQASDNGGDVENDIIDCYINGSQANLGSSERVAGREQKLDPEQESKPQRRYIIGTVDRQQRTSGTAVQRSESLKTHMNTYSNARDSAQINPTRSLRIPRAQARDGSDTSRMQRSATVKHTSTYSDRRDSTKINRNLDIPTPKERGDGSGMARSNTKTSREHAAEYRTLLGEGHRPFCYSPSNYSRATLEEAPIARRQVQRQVREQATRPVSEATTHWSMIDQAEILGPPIQPIPPLRIRKDKRKIGKG
ncbi:hypothetical protein FQN49_002173 [Arthroderma sp. PD_2]|nr:hypothetical protein FQN49_002173 [Arthroderma sp. PD_2]